MASGGDRHFPVLPPEIIINILTRLPAKCIFRFQCVCKEWKNLFKTPSFIAEQVRRSDHENHFLLLHEYNHQYRCSLSLVNHGMETVEVLNIPSIFRGSLRIIGSCNGLLCVEVGRDRDRSPGSLWLWNPAINEVREVPQTLNDYWRICKIGFGFSSVANDYKIVRFYNQQFRKKKEDQAGDCDRLDRVEVYSLSTGSWKELEFDDIQVYGDLQRINIISKAVNAYGALFWFGSRRFPPEDMVVWFDIATEVFTLTPMPTQDSIHLNLGVYENKIEGHYVIRETSGSFFIRVSVMEEVASEDGRSSSCTQKYRIGPVSIGLGPQCVWRNEIVCLHKKFQAELEGEPKCVLHLFNLITNEGRNFNCSTHCYYCETFNYEKSLVSVLEQRG